MQPGLPSHDPERRPDVPRKPVQLPHQRRPGAGHRELLRRRRLRLRLRAPGEPGERSPRGGHPGGHGRHHDLFRPVRPHERRLHRVHVQVGHEQVCAEAPTAIWPSDALNTQGFFKLPKTPLDNKNWGATLGGPIIKNKTFFFVNADWTRFRSGTLEGFGNTTPIDAFKAGDFSALLTGNADRRRRARAGPSSGARSSTPPPRAWSTAFPCATPIRATSSRPTIRCAAWSPRGTPPSWCTPTGRACRTTWPATRRATRPGSSTRATSSSAWTTPSRPGSRRRSAATTTTARRSVTAAGPRAAPSRTTP